MNENRATTKRINHERIDELFANPLKADRDAVYAKQLYLDLSTLSPYVTGPDSPSVATPLHEIAPKNIKIDRACKPTQDSVLPFFAVPRVARYLICHSWDKLRRICLPFMYF